jgi:hypothetical protein
MTKIYSVRVYVASFLFSQYVLNFIHSQIEFDLEKKNTFNYKYFLLPMSDSITSSHPSCWEPRPWQQAVLNELEEATSTLLSAL